MQTPEWKKAYMYSLLPFCFRNMASYRCFSDYRGLKKQINAIEEARRQHQQEIIENADKAERPRSRSATPPPLSPYKLTFEEPLERALRRNTRISIKSDSPSTGRGANRMSFRSIFPTLVAPLVSKSRRKSYFYAAIIYLFMQRSC